MATYISLPDWNKLSPLDALDMLNLQINQSIEISNSYTDTVVSSGTLPPGSTVDGGTY